MDRSCARTTSYSSLESRCPRSSAHCDDLAAYILITRLIRTDRRNPAAAVIDLQNAAESPAVHGENGQIAPFEYFSLAKLPGRRRGRKAHRTAPHVSQTLVNFPSRRRGCRPSPENYASFDGQVTQSAENCSSLSSSTVFTASEKAVASGFRPFLKHRKDLRRIRTPSLADVVPSK